ALFAAKTGANMVHMPYKGAGPALQAVFSGEVQFWSGPAPLPRPHIKAGGLRALAYNGAKRASFLPDVPTVLEQGVTGTEMPPSWHGVVAPAQLPPALVPH